METHPQLSNNAQALLETLAATGQAVRLASVAGGLEPLASEWARHVEEAEDHLFPRLVAGGAAADGPVGFCLAEHAALSARLAGLEAAHPTPAWFREAEVLITRLVQHLFLEARILQPLLEHTAPAGATDRTGHHPEGRGRA